MTIYKLVGIIAAISLLVTIIRYFISKPSNIFVGYVQNFVGVFFIFSGFVKAIDPLGTSYKIGEYFTEFGMGFLEPYTLAFSVVTIVMEIVLGIMLILGYMTKLVSILLLLLILFFTFLTGYTTITGNVTDCGCFGDFLKLEPYQSFIKDICLSILILVIFFARNSITTWLGSVVSGAITITSIIGFTVFCFSNFYWDLPLVDFRPYKIGNYLPKLIEEIPDKVEYAWVYKEKSSGTVKEFTDAEFSKVSSEPGFKDNYEFVERKIARVIEKGVPAKISNFHVVDDEGNDVSEDILYYPEYFFMVVAYDLKKTSVEGFTEKLNPLAEAAEKEGYWFFAVTSATADEREKFRHENQTAFPYYEADPVFLKTIIRSNPGLVLMKNGTVIGKWHHKQIPTFEEIKKNYLK